MSRRRRRGRRISGVLVLDKPPGVSSNRALQQVKRLYDAEKAGHTGSLDPIATGVLPICLGEATKFSRFLLDADKAYEATYEFGCSTETGDSEGEVTATAPVEGVDAAAIESLLGRFRGEIEQTPGMYSAIKHEGQALYRLARKGIEVERKPRRVRIDEYVLTGLRQSRVADRLEGDFLIRCSKGTYIRSLAEALGEALGCGAHVSALRRTAAGPYLLENSYNVSALHERLEQAGFPGLDACLESPASAVRELPVVCLTELAAYYLLRGQPVVARRAPASGWVQLCSDREAEGGRFLGVGEILSDGRVAPRRLVV